MYDKIHYNKKKKKYWSFSFSISPSSEYSGLLSFRMDWLDLLAVQGTLCCWAARASLLSSEMQTRDIGWSY